MPCNEFRFEQIPHRIHKNIFLTFFGVLCSAEPLLDTLLFPFSAQHLFYFRYERE